MRFTIRDLLWLTVVVALGFALWREHRLRLASDRAYAVEVERYEELWQSANSPFGSEDDMLFQRKREFPAEMFNR